MLSETTEWKEKHAHASMLFCQTILLFAIYKIHLNERYDDVWQFALTLLLCALLLNIFQLQSLNLLYSLIYNLSANLFRRTLSGCNTP